MKALFQNPKMALAYVGITMASVALFVGTEDAPGSLQQTVKSFGGGAGTSGEAADRKFGDPPPGKGPAKREEPVVQEIIEFVPDDELIDSAEGFDPNPTEDFSGFNPNPDERPFLSEQDKKKPAEDDGGWATPPEQ